MPKLQNRPESQEDQNSESLDPGYDPQSMPLGDPSDPRGDLPSDAEMGSASDPSSQMHGTPMPEVYDTAGNDEGKPGLGKRALNGLGLGRDEEKNPNAANSVRQRLKKAEDSPDASDKDDKRASEPSDLDDAESRGDRFGSEDDGDESGFFNEDDDEPRRHKAGRFLKRHKRKIGIGGTILAGVVGGGFGLFMLLLPLKIEHIVDNLQGTFFSTSQQALSTEMRNMVKSYLITRVMPGYKSCGSTIKAGCSARKFGTNPVSEMFRTWSDERLESKLAAKNIVLEYKRLPGKWYLEAPGVSGGKVDIGSDGSGLGREIDTHTELRATMDQVIKNETKWYQVYTRYKLGRYLENKFGLPRCIVICRIVGKDRYDAFHTTIKDKKNEYGLKLVQRVITPHDQTLGIVLECLLTDCAATDNQPSGEDGENGTPRSKTDAEITDALRKYGGSVLSNISDETLSKTYKDIEEKGLQKYLITKALTPIIGETAAGTAGDVIPVAGWINLAAQIVNAGNDASANLKKLRLDVNGAAMASIFVTWLVYADEIHTGSVDPTEVGSFTSSLGPGNQGSDSTPTGGAAGAEQTKIYQNLIEKKKGSGSAAAATASIDNFLEGTAYADSASDIASGAAGEICNNGLPVPAGQLICNEDFLGGGNSIANGIHDFLGLPGVNVLTTLAQVWKASAGVLFKIGGNIMAEPFQLAAKAADKACGLPGPLQGPFAPYCGIKSLASSAIPTIVKGVTSQLIPDPLGLPMGGGRNFALGAGGADYTGNDSAHRILGGQAITPQQKADIVAQQDAQDRYEFSHQSFFARMFSGSSQYSLISKLAMDVPFGSAQTIAASGVANLINPVSALTHSFGSIFSADASADTTAQADPYGLTQYGYPPGTIPDDPEAYWKAHCSDNAANAYQKDNSWNKAASGTENADPETGEPLNKKVNPCLLIKATVGAGGGLFDTSNLTKDDLADVDGAAGSDDTVATGPVTGVPGSGSGSFTTDTSHPAYPGVDKMLARVENINKDPSAAAAFCANFGGCGGMCESAVEWAWLGHRGQYANPYGNSNPNGPPGSGSAWKAAMASGHAHPGDRNPPVGALLIYTIPGDENGHITIYLGNNQVFSTDFDHPGSAGIDPASHIESGSWANSYVGWMDPYWLNGKEGDLG